MTDYKSKASIKSAIGDISISPLCLEIKKGKRSACLVCSAVVSIVDYSSESLTVATHKGRVSIVGEGLVLSVLENRTVEVFGKIEGVEMSYGKH